ncbi:MAG: efflux RND transporter permease subunit [Firmicutes bacterium]|nr:efflux RND transporter permease subunit [Bacillota bacterium]
MIEYLLRRQKITLLFFVMIFAMGLLTVFQLPRQEQPDIVISIATVTTVFPGATPEKVERTVTNEIEQNIKEIQGVKTINSYSGHGYSSITVWLKDDVDPKEKWDELRKKVTDAEAELPDGVEKPLVNDNLGAIAFFSFNVTAQSREQLYNLRETLDNWKDQLRTVQGVSDVQYWGLPEQEVRVELDTWKLQHYGITWSQVMAAITGENEKIPIGDLEVAGRNFQMILPNNYQWEQLNKVVVNITSDGVPVYLKDVGNAYLANKNEEIYAYHNGMPSAIMGISVEEGTDAPSLHQNIEQMLQKLTKNLPSGVEIAPVYSQNEKVNEMSHDLLREMIIAISAVLLVCTLGLNFITALMVAIAIPISMAVGLIFLPGLDITLNMMSIYGLIVVLGVLVDDAVVVNDNIERRLHVLKEKPFEASVKGAQEVSASILTATLATIFSFGPLMFLSGISGDYIRPIPVVVSLTMLTSMVMALTIIPIFRNWYETRMLKKGKSTGSSEGILGNQLQNLTNWYAGYLMPRILKQPLKVGLTGILIGTLAYGLIPFTPVELFPTADREELPINIRMPKGSDIEETNTVVREIQQWLAKQPGVKEISGAAGARPSLWFGGGTGIDSQSEENAQIVVKLDLDKVNASELVESWRNKLEMKYPGVSIYPWELQTGPPVGEPIELHLYGDDITQLRELTQQVKEKITKIPGAYDIQDNFGLDNNTLEFQVNRAMLEQKMITYTNLSRTIRLAGEGITVSQFDNGKDLIDINLYANNSGESSISVLQHLMVPNALGQQIPLSEIVEVKPAFNIQNIPHRNLSRSVTITGDVRGRTATEVMTDVTSILEKTDFPDGYHWEVGGEMTEQTDIFIDMAKLSVIVFFLIFIQIVIQFYSLSLPILIMSTVYLATAGSLIGLFITRTPLGFMTMMGVISLAGIVVRNGIVLIDFIEKARSEGMELKEAVLKAGEARLRPILLTSMTAVAGLTPLAIIGGPLFSPLAMTIISGLVFSTILTLMIVPALYTVLAQYKEKRKSKKA